MTEETKHEAQDVEETQAAPEGGEAQATAGEAKRSGGDPLKDALKQFERQVGVFGQALGEALQGRGNVVMVRVNDEALAHLDMLVEAELTKSRSESAAYLINAGIQANQALFERISAITQQIAELREQLRQQVRVDDEPEQES